MAENGSSKEKMLETGKMRHDVRLGKAKSSEAFRNSRASNFQHARRDKKHTTSLGSLYSPKTY
jgi:hypothetical protein